MRATLDSVPVDNGTMLVTTMVLWTSELGDGAPGFENLPVVIAGASSSKLGQYIHSPSYGPFESCWWDGTKLPGLGRPHRTQLTSILQGSDVREADGDLISSMPIREVMGINDASIDCTRRLEQLFA